MNTATASQRRAPLPALTGIRFFAAIHVVFYHYAPAVAMPWPGLMQNGYMAVGLFFILSGFVLAYNYGDRRMDAPKFWVARFARIYPAYLLAFILIGPAVVARWLPHDPAKLAAGGTAAACLLQGWFPSLALVWNGPGWSLSNEAFFYLLFPAILAGAARLSVRGLRVAFFCTWAAALLPPLFLAGLPSSSETAALMYVPALRLGEFGIGVVTGLMYLRGVRVPYPGAVFGLAVVAAFCPGSVPVVLRGALVAPVLGLFVAALAGTRNRVTRVLAFRPLEALGDASYSVYILQSPVLAFFLIATQGIHSSVNHAPLGWVQFVLYCLVLVLLSMACYKYIESPLRGFIVRRFGQYHRFPVSMNRLPRSIGTVELTP